MKADNLGSRTRGQAVTEDWDALWSAPATGLEQLAPLLAIGVAALVALL